MADAIGRTAAGAARGGRWWNDPRKRAIIYQAIFVLGVASAIYFIVANTIRNLRHPFGFDFFDQTYGADLGESLIPFQSSDTFFRAYLVGLINTLQVSVLGIVLTTVLGTIIGIARLSSNWLIAKLAGFYVEAIRNVPLLLQLVFIYVILTATLPSRQTPFKLADDVYLSKSGLQFPLIALETIHIVALLILAAGVAATLFYFAWTRRVLDRTGRLPPRLIPALALILLPLAFLVVTIGAFGDHEFPKETRFGFFGGARLTPEFAAMLIGLTIYTAAFVAEIVRSGILGVSYGQTEAALALGHTRGQILRLVILPQALRIVIPPMTNQYLNLIKNSSLATVIGYPELVAVANIGINQTGRAIEGVITIMAVYLSINLAVSLFMNWYNKRVALVER